MKRFYKFLMPLVAIVALASPLGAQAQDTVTIGTGTSTSYYIPFNSLYGYSFTEMVYAASDIEMAGQITAVQFHLGQSYSSAQTNTITLYMKNVSRSSFTSSTDIEAVTASDIVFTGSWTIPASYTGWVTIELDTPFDYDGTSNLMVAMHESTSGYSTRNFTYTSVSNSAVQLYSDSYNPDPSNLSSYSGSKTTRNYLANMRLAITSGEITCNRVRGITATDIAPWSCTLNWVDTLNSGASYTVITMPDSTVMASGITDTTVTLTGLTPDHSYLFGVIADCGAGDESRATTVGVHTLVSCPNPTLLQVDSVNTSEITLSWTPGYEETSWLLAINDSVVDVTDNPYTITDLTANTLYSLRVRAICGDGDTSIYSSPLNVRTLPGEPVTVFPYTCGFEDAEENAGWVLDNGSAANQWFIGSAVNNGGTNALYVSNNNGTSNAYNNGTSSHVYAYRYINFSDTGAYVFSFDWRCEGESHYYDYLRAWLVPASVYIEAGDGTTYNYSTIQLPGCIDLVPVNNDGMHTLAESSSFTTLAGEFRISTPGTYKLAFLWSNDASGGDNPPAAVDNVFINVNSCPAPVDLTIDSLMPTSIDLHWTAIGEETEWALQVGDTLITGITNTNYTVTGLDQYTLYTMRVYAVCDAGETSIPSPSVTGRTTVSCPWPVSLVATATGGDTVSVTWTAGAGSSATDYYLVYGPSGFNPATVGEGNWINVPGATNYEITGLTAGLWDVYVRADCGGDDGISAWAGPASVGLGYMNIDQVDTLYTCGVIICDNGGPTGDYTASRNDQVVIYPVDNMHGLTITGNSYTEGTYDYVYIYEGVGTGGTLLWSDYGVSAHQNLGPFDVEGPITITFHSDGSVYYDGFEISVTCYDLNGCVRPSNLVCTSTTPDSVAISWNGNGASGWEVFVGPAGSQPDADSAIAVSDSSYVFTTLSGGVTYDIYVRSDCSGDYSDWRGPLTVTPGTYVIGTSGSASITMCGGVIYDDGGATGQYSNSADFVLTVYPSHPDSMLTFQGWAYTESSIDYLRIYEGTSPTGTILWQTSTSSQLDNIPYTIVTSGPITLKWHTDGSVVYDGFELQIGCMAAPECSPVDNLTVRPTPTAALLTWQPGYYGVYSGATVEYKADTAESWITLPAVTGTYAVINGLDASTDYNVRVITDCEGFPGGVATADFTSASYGCLEADSTGSRTITVGTGSSTTSYFPTYSCYNYSLTEQVFTPLELGGGGNLTAMTMTPTSVVSPTRSVEIYLGHVSNATLANFEYPSDLTLVYTGTVNLTANTPCTFTLDNAFMYNGADNLLVMFRDMTGSFSCSNSWASTSSTSGVSRYIYQDSGPYSIGTTGGSSSSDRANTTFSFLTCQTYASCAAPAVAVVDLTTTTATVVWAPGNGESSWNLSYRLAGDAAWSTPVTVSGSSYTVSGLLSGRKYEFKIENACSEGNFSATTQGTTLCAQISSLPFTENFNGWGTGVVPNCWSNAGSYTPTSYGVISGSYNHSGSTGGSLYMYSSSTLSNKTYVSLPELDTLTYHANQLQLVFSLFYTSTSYGRPAIEVGVMSDPNNPGSFVVVDTVQHSGALSTWEVFEVPMSGYTGNGSYVAVRTAFDSAYSYFYLDDLTLEVIPTCPRPDSLTATNATTNSVDLSWHERGGASQWIIEYGPRGFQLGTGTTVTATSNPFTLTGLPASFQGEYYVKSICGAGDTGEYSRMSYGFGTTQVPATLPYNYDFEDAAEWANWQTSSNSETNNWYRGTSVADSGSNAMYIAAGDTASYFNYAFNAVVNAAAYRDIDFGAVDSSFTLSFRARVGGTTTAAYDGLMVFLVDPSIATTPSSSNITSPWGNVNDLYRIATVRLDTNWTTYEASFDTISGIQRVAFFWFNQNTGASYTNIPQPAAVDNIHIAYSSCPRPLNLEATFAGSNTATLTWDGAAGATYEVVYRQVGGSNITAIANTNSITLTGLASTSEYRAWVRKICGAGDTSLYSDGTAFNTTMCDGAVTVATGDPSTATGTTYYAPVNNFYNYTLSETIIDSAELGGAMNITSIAYYYDYSDAMTDKNNVTIWIQPTTKSAFSSSSDIVALDTTTAVQVYSGNLNCSEGWNYFAFTTDYSYSGTGNLLVIVDDNSGEYNSSSYVFASQSTSAYKTIVYYSDSNNPDINNLSSSFSGNKAYYQYRPVMQLISCGGVVLCADPEIVDTTVTETSVTVSWNATGAANYEVAIVEGNWVDPTTATSVAATSYTFNGLTPGTNYAVGVRSDCGNGNTSQWTIINVATAEHPCYAPTNLTVGEVTFSSAVLSWTPGEAETEWVLHVTGTNLDSTFNVTTNPYTLTGLRPGVEYSVTVAAVCSETQQSDATAAQTFTTPTCQPVSGVTVSNRTTSGATISWNAPSGVNSFELEYGLSGFGQGAGTRVTVTGTSYTLAGLAEATMYDVLVRSVCGTGIYSDWSNRASFETLDGGSQQGIEDIANANIALYPNPATTTVTLTGFDGQATVTIVDMNGRAMGEYIATNNTLTIDLTGYAQGAYFVRITGEQVNAIRKLIVK